jgi:hypothetical protein
MGSEILFVVSEIVVEPTRVFLGRVSPGLNYHMSKLNQRFGFPTMIELLPIFTNELVELTF